MLGFASFRIVIVSVFFIMINVSAAAAVEALDIIRRADEIRSPNKPFRYTVTVFEYKDGEEKEENKQILDISMRFMKPEKGMPADARSLARFIYPPRDKGNIMLSDWYDLWFYTPTLRRPIPVSREQRLVGQISNGDVIVTNFEYSYSATLSGDKLCGESICYELVLLRKSDAVTYPKIIYLVERDNYHPYQASYYSMDDKLLKTVKYENFQMVLGEMRPMKIIVRDAKHSKGYSVMEYSDARFESLPESNFTREYIQRGAR
ncbi:outer membrane lipoprotein-sorting protein [Kosakonia sp. R1.Fl]|uniref:outer membrane lipoprotein-sorting protein n=1 Tax=Kosakonia sp. R1.Fl TaxID=2928706 RepID=UPI00201D4567|nr:outer membrane lipoprotein-sorting protein [Kosakonia sp. R1.Fl]MCL6746274.1 outer membrane lipoprotein-sorting protein [Kosakonia sp. R1.Fl]